MYDVVIVGGGPAGSTLARLIGEKYKVLLLEKRTFKDPSLNICDVSQKCCGGLLNLDAQKMLASFGLGLPKSVILSPQMFSVRTIDIDNSIERHYQRHYINIDREQFDRWLQSLVAPKVDVLYGSLYLSHKEQKNYVDLSFYREGKIHKEKAKLIIGADGAFSKVRRLSFPNYHYPKTYIALQEWFEEPQKINYYGAIFDSKVTDFYSWLIPKDKYLIVGSAIPLNTNVHERFSLLKTELKDYGFELDRSLARNGAYLLRTVSPKQIMIGKGRVGLVGESAGFISPSSAEGISYAFRSALALSKALSCGLETWLDQYKANTSNLRRNIKIKNCKIPFMYNPLLRNFIMKVGIMSIDLHLDL